MNQKHYPVDSCALLVVDVLEGNFLGTDMTEENRSFADACKRVVDICRDKGIPVIHCTDAHMAENDHEVDLWGEHAIAGTSEAEPASILGDTSGDYRVKKRRYSSFYGTDLDCLLRELGVRNLIVIGADTNICVMQTIADAFYRSYNCVVVPDATYTFLIGTQAYGIEYMKTCFGVDFVLSENLEESIVTPENVCDFYSRSPMDEPSDGALDGVALGASPSSDAVAWRQELTKDQIKAVVYSSLVERIHMGGLSDSINDVGMYDLAWRVADTVADVWSGPGNYVTREFFGDREVLMPSASAQEEQQVRFLALGLAFPLSYNNDVQLIKLS